MQLQGPLAGSFQVCPPRPGGTQDYWRLRSSNRWWCGRACCLHMCAWRNGQDLNYCVNVSKFHTTHWRLIKEIYSTENRKVHKSICQGEHYALSYGIIAWSCCYRLILEVCIALPHTNNKNWKNEDHSKMFSVTNHLMKASFKCLPAESMKCEVSGVQRKEIKENKQRKYKTAKFLMRNYWSGLRDLFGNFSKLNKLYNQLLKNFRVYLLHSCCWYSGHMLLVWLREASLSIDSIVYSTPCNLRWTLPPCSPHTHAQT